jgi:serine/threonine protein kinase
LGQEDGVTPTSGDSLVGKQLGDFQLQGLLGAGGMAEVYRGFDTKLKRAVAVKVLPAAMSSDAGYVQRFRNEAQRVAALNHPHIVPLYHFGEEGALLYHVMPILKESLRDRLDREERLAPQDAVRLVVQIASALSVAHAAGLVHRDVKPENVLLDEKGAAFLTDFGIARPITLSRVGRAAQTLSATGLPVGTPEYMAPEQLRGELVDQRADIYALGAVLYELLTGHAPHEADTPYEVAALSLMGQITPPSTRNPQVNPELEDVVMIALSSDPAARYPDASSLAFAARRSVFPRGRSLLTGLPGLRRATRENSLPLRRRAGRPNEPPTQPLARDDSADSRSTAVVWALPGVGKGGTRRPPLTGRWLFAALAATVLVVGLCGAGSYSLARQMQLPLFGFAPTVTALPTATLEPTATPEPTMTPVPTATATPTLRLLVGQFTWAQSGSSTCIGHAQITNPGGNRTMGWHWEVPITPQPPFFRWGFANPPTGSGNLPVHDALPSGQADTLYISVRQSCSINQTTYSVTMKDTLSRTYTITFTPH